MSEPSPILSTGDSATLPPEPTRRWRRSKGPIRSELFRRSQASYSAETRLLLRSRLKAATIFLLAVHAAFSLRLLILWIETPLGLAWQILSFLIIMAIAGVVCARPSLTLFQLRALEVTLMVLATGDMAATKYVELQDMSDHFGKLLAASMKESLDALLLLNTVGPLLPFIWLMMLYGMLIPNSWQRAALVCLPLALAPVLVRISFAVQDPGLRELASVERVSLSLVLILVGYASAVYGTFVINTLRHEAFEARRLGQYQLVRKLGAGGMGEVWQGRHTMLARPAAIKLIRPDVLGGHTPQESHMILARFEREAQATAGLSSPHSIVLYDFGITKDETFYYVMELLDGLDLETLIERFGPMPPTRAIYLLLQACESLADAHDSGLIHRDVKPANLFVCRLGRVCDFVKVLDFGLVKSREMPGKDAAQLTQVGTVTGTPACMPPEQALGKPIDHRADIYGLGCVAYWLMTGRNVFEGDSVMSVLADHVRTLPTPPSQVSELPIGSDLDKVVLSCLAKSPEDRPVDCHVLAESLRHCPEARQWGRRDAARWWELHLGAKGRSSETHQPQIA